MGNSKILLIYQDDEGNCQAESVWVTKEGDYYRINNIPFFAPNVSLNDLVSVEIDNDALYFDELIEASGHSTIQMVIFNNDEVMAIGKELEGLGCTWEGSNIKNMISIDVPKSVVYNEIKKYLDNGERNQKWSYKESSLAHSY